tara:strand:+ start:2488 stop:2610 length:123 start_codon:yes stop_codon:yes gene_type:complete
MADLQTLKITLKNISGATHMYFMCGKTLIQTPSYTLQTPN